MSRSRKYPVLTITKKIDKEKAHRKVRHKVKEELAKPEIDEIIIESDTRDIGEEEFGTKIDFMYEGDEEDKEKASRK